jgi:hypothetical protein
MPPLAAILFVWGGFLILMGGANPGLISKGKSIFWNTAIGVAIISASWLITNSIIRSVAEDNVASEWWKLECRTTVPVQQPPPSVTRKYLCNSDNQCVADPNGQYITDNCDNKCQVPVGGALSISNSNLPDATKGINYSTSLTATGGTAPYIWSVSSGTLPPGLSISGSNISGTPTTTGTSTLTIKVEDSSSPKKSVTKQLSINVKLSGGTNTVTYGTCTGVACQGDTTSVCGPVDPGDGCDFSAVNKLNAAIVAGAGNKTICGGINTVKMLKTIIANESNGVIDIVSGDGKSAGPFQLTPETANRFRAQCGVTEVIGFSWLRRANTVSKQACIAAEFIKSFVGTCGCDVRQIAAGYNGGPTACADSNACGQQAAANGGQCSACNVSRPTRKWECLWEDTQHNSCNKNRTGGGYSHTRIYAPRVEFCYNRF